MADESGWQRRLFASLVGPPIARLHFSTQNGVYSRELPQFTSGASMCLGLGMVRSLLNQTALLDDFLMGGTDLFSAGLAWFAVNDCCMMNASFLVMFLVWSLTNAILFNLFLSFIPNLIHHAIFMSGPGWFRAAAFLADNAVILASSALQLRLAYQARLILNDALPGWSDQVAWGTGGRPGATLQQPLLAPAATSARRVQPPSGQRGTEAFRPFSGSGQRLGGGRG